MKQMLNWFNKYAPTLLGGMWIAFMFLLSMGAVIWAIKWILSMIGVI